MHTDWVVLGLGNPVSSRTGPLRANVGAIVVEAIAGEQPFRRSGVVELCPVTLLDVSVTLAKVSSFMDRAGPLIAQHIHDKQVPPSNLIILHDDAETLQLGGLRIRTRGPAGGHKGMSSVLRALGGETVAEIKRIRIGTGQPPLASRRDDLTSNDVDRLRVISHGVARAVRLLVLERVDAAMSLYNRRDRGIDTVPGLVRPLDSR